MKIFEYFGEILLKDDGVNKKLDAVEQKAKGAADKLDKTSSKMGAFGEKMTNVGTKIAGAGTKLTAGITTPLVAIGALAGMTAINFDDSMRKVQATMGDKLGKSAEEAEANIAKLRAEAELLGSTTAFSASEAAAGMDKLALAGWDTNQIMEATGPMLNLASAAAMDLDTAADIVTDTMSAFSMEATDAGKATDIFAKAQSSSNTDVQQLGEAMKYVGANANAAGMDLEETTAILGKLADAGLKGSSAGTTLNAMLRDVKKNAENGKVAIGDTSVAVYDANGNMKDMTTIMGEIEVATEGMTGEQRDAALSSVFMEESMKGANIILGTGAGKVRELEDALRNSSGTAAEMKETMEGGIGGAMRSMKSAIEGAAISLGDTLAPAIQWVADKVTWAAQAFSGMNEKTQLVMVIVAALAAAIGPLLLVFGGMIASVGAIIGVLGAVTAPVWGVIAGIVALIAILTTAYATSETFRNIVSTVFSAIKNIVMQALEIVVAFVREKLVQLQAFWAENGTMILQAVTNVWNAIKAVFEFLMPVIMFVIQSAWNAIKGIINGALNIIMGLVKTFAALFTGNWGAMWEGIKQLLWGVVELIWNYLNLMFIGRILRGIGGFAKAGASAIKGFGTKIVNFFKGAWDKAWNLVDDFVEAALKLINLFKSKGQSIFEAYKNLVLSIFRSLKSGAMTVINSFKTAAVNSFNALKTAAGNIFNAVKTAITKPIQTAKDTVLKIIRAIKDAFAKMKIKIPKPKLPKVSVSMKKGVMGIPYPDFNVRWNRKGAVYPGNMPALAGIGDGPDDEAILPLNKGVFGSIAEGITNQLKNLGGIGGGGSEAVQPIINIYLDGDDVAGILEPKISVIQGDKMDARSNLLGNKRGIKGGF